MPCSGKSFGGNLSAKTSAASTDLLSRALRCSEGSARVVGKRESAGSAMKATNHSAARVRSSVSTDPSPPNFGGGGQSSVPLLVLSSTCVGVSEQQAGRESGL
jgi:hypothetical protein